MRKPRPTRRIQNSVPHPQGLWLYAGVCLLLVSRIGVAVGSESQKQSAMAQSGLSAAYSPRAKGTLTFTKDIAPIIFSKCSFCHRPGQSGPFSLLSYKQVQSRGRAIRDVVESRFMPPWLPERGYGHFAGDRALTPEQRGMLLQWLGEGAPEGKPGDLPALPNWPADWELGPPDLIVTLPAAYTLPAEGKDIYRNFVVPIQNSESHYVRAVEFHPGNTKVVHHAFIETDDARQSRYLTEGSQPPGFDGMDLPPSVHMPLGQMLGWQPGKPAMQSPEGLSWVLASGSDLVLQLHMHPSGKPEVVRPSVGFYFIDRAPTNSMFLLKLARYVIDIPAGQKDYRIENSYVLPIDVDLMRINPHTHYLGKQLEGWATLPDGTRKELLLIKNWDFNWQGDYPYQDPIPLPKGTTLSMRFSYDNSSQNIHNPSRPPKRVKYGLQTTDEMGELWFQVLPRDREDLAALSKDFFIKMTRDTMELIEWRLKSNPQDATSHAQLGSALFTLGQVDEAVQHLSAAARLDPTNALAHSQLGGIYLRLNRLPEARNEFEAVLRADPRDYEAQGSLGFICMQEHRYAEAETFFQKALEINPEDTIARANLDALRKARAVRP